MAHWRDSARTPRFFFVDGRATFPLLLFLLHIRLWTFIIAVTFSIFFSSLQYFGFTLTIFTRWFRNLLAGDRKSTNHWFMR